MNAEQKNIMRTASDIAGCAWDDREDRTSPLAVQIRAVAELPGMGTDGSLTWRDRAALRELAEEAEALEEPRSCRIVGHFHGGKELEWAGMDGWVEDGDSYTRADAESRIHAARATVDGDSPMLISVRIED